MTKLKYDVFYTKIIYSKQFTKYENKCFFLYSKSGFEFRIKKIKTRYTTF